MGVPLEILGIAASRANSSLSTQIHNSGGQASWQPQVGVQVGADPAVNAGKSQIQLPAIAGKGVPSTKRKKI